MIPQRELRNNVSEVLRRAEGGERLTITVGGRPVAELGPPRRATHPPTTADLQRVLASTPVDSDWTAELTQTRNEDAAVSREPWQR